MIYKKIIIQLFLLSLILLVAGVLASQDFKLNRISTDNLNVLDKEIQPTKRAYKLLGVNPDEHEEIRFSVNRFWGKEIDDVVEEGSISRKNLIHSIVVISIGITVVAIFILQMIKRKGRRN